MLDANAMLNEYGVPIKRQRITPPLSERVMLYVRQDNEDVYTALHVVPPTTNGLISAVSDFLLPIFIYFLLSSSIKKSKNIYFFIANPNTRKNLPT